MVGTVTDPTNRLTGIWENRLAFGFSSIAKRVGIRQIECDNLKNSGVKT